LWAVIQHVDYDSEGAIGNALRRAEGPWVSVRPFRGDPVPRTADLSGLISLGAPDGSADDRGCAHLMTERRLIADAVGLGLPVLGVCFGAQLLAVALGGRVISDGVPEVGMGAAALTDAGRADRVLGSAARQGSSRRFESTTTSTDSSFQPRSSTPCSWRQHRDATASARSSAPPKRGRRATSSGWEGDRRDTRVLPGDQRQPVPGNGRESCSDWGWRDLDWPARKIRVSGAMRNGKRPEAESRNEDGSRGRPD
jgi:GMP synthase-like glutamine amidotransferase